MYYEILVKHLPAISVRTIDWPYTLIHEINVKNIEYIQQFETIWLYLLRNRMFYCYQRSI